MRRIALAIAVLCAILAGWMPALAQVHGIAVQAGQHDHAGTQTGAESGHHGRAADCSGDCRHPQKTVHPVLCSACFAIEVADLGLSRVKDLSVRIVPAPALPLEALDPAPGSPPPKSRFPT